jgi:hypothetical protein
MSQDHSPRPFGKTIETQWKEQQDCRALKKLQQFFFLHILFGMYCERQEKVGVSMHCDRRGQARVHASTLTIQCQRQEKRGPAIWRLPRRLFSSQNTVYSCM